MSGDRKARMGDVLNRMVGTPSPTEGVPPDEVMSLAMEFIFGEVWSRPGLDLKLRSVAVISILAARGAEFELRHHLAIGLRNGLTPTEIRELLLQIGVYAGAPSMNVALKLANEVFAEAGVG